MLPCYWFAARGGVGTNHRHQWQQKQVLCCALSLYRQISTRLEAVVAKDRCFTVLGLVAKHLGWEGLVAKSVAKINWPVGFCRQLSPKVQSIKKALVVVTCVVQQWCW
jgi:hypothetical protein